jgi:hypothetical protein
MSQAFECWHCKSPDPAKPGTCNCIFCGLETSAGFVPGPCGMCQGRINHAKIAEKLDVYNIDPREHRHWRLYRHTTGGAHWVFDPVYPGEER